MMRKDLYVFRHGETDLNRQQRIQGSGCDVELNENGLQQAESLITKFADIPLEVIFSSPLKRAMQTAQVVATAKKIAVVQKNDLRECFYGVAEGMKIAEVKEKYAAVKDNWNNPDVWDIAYPQGESKKEAFERVWAQIEKLGTEKYDVMGVAIHGGTMTSLLNYLQFDFSNIANCAAFHLVLTDKGAYVDGDLF
jgi:probable phosphoglycerate mutase